MRRKAGDPFPPRQFGTNIHHGVGPQNDPRYAFLANLASQGVQRRPAMRLYNMKLASFMEAFISRHGGSSHENATIAWAQHVLSGKVFKATTPAPSPL